MKKNCILIVLVCLSLPLQSTWKHKIRKYGIYLGCATVGCLVTLFATQHKKTRPYFKNFLFPNYVQAHGNLVNEVGTLNQQLGNTNQQLQNSTTQLQGIRSQLEASQQTNLALRNNYNALSIDHAALRLQNTNQESDIELLQKHLTTLNAQAKLQGQQLETLMGQLSTLEKRGSGDSNTLNSDEKRLR